MTDEQVDKIFDLISRSKPTARTNIRFFYLDRLGNAIIDHCIKYYKLSKNPDVRCDLVGFIIQFAKTNENAIELATLALSDKSKLVRRYALSVFAYSLNDKYLGYLKSLQGKLKGNEEDLQNAINAIENKDHNLFYPDYDQWVVSHADMQRHLNKEKFAEDVKIFIETYSKEVVPELTQILGSLYE